MDINSVLLYNDNDQNGKPVVSGHLIFIHKTNIGYKKILNVDHLEDCLNSLFINESLFDHSYFCDNEKERLHYDNRRLMFVFAAFENAYNVVREKKEHGEKLLEVKKDIVNYIKRRKKDVNAKNKKYWRSFEKYVNDYGKCESFQTKVSNSLMQFYSIFDIIFKEYNDPPKGKKSDIDKFSETIGVCRNNLAHAKQEDILTPYLIEQTKVIEKLIYCMKLRHYGVSFDGIKIVLNDLF